MGQFVVLKLIVCAVFLVSANITDFREYRISNKVILSVIAIGMILGVFGKTLSESVYGMLIPLVLFPLYALKMLGAGDIKSFCALGALFGYGLSVKIMIFSFLAGGVIAVIFLVCGRRGLERLRYFFDYLRTCIVIRKVRDYNFGGSAKGYFRFSYAITAGTVIAIVNYFM